MNKEQLRRDLPGMIDALRAELADVCAKWTFTLTDDRAAKHEQTYRKQAAKLRWRIDRATEVLQELETPGAFLYDMLPDWTCDRFGEMHALLWWADRLIYAGMDRSIKTVTTTATVSIGDWKRFFGTLAPSSDETSVRSGPLGTAWTAKVDGCEPDEAYRERIRASAGYDLARLGAEWSGGSCDRHGVTWTGHSLCQLCYAGVPAST